MTLPRSEIVADKPFDQKMVSSFILLLTLAISSNASPEFNEAFPEWPDYCCNLELTRHTFGDMLPADMIFGETTHKHYGYMVDRNELYEVLGVSELFDEPVIRLTTNGCVHHPRNSFEILTNPNKCAIDWYTTRYVGEKFINSSGVSMRSNEIFMPAFNGYFFASRSFVDYPDSFGHFHGSLVTTCIIGTEKTPFQMQAAGTNILYVDCLKSLMTMSKGKLVNMTLNNPDLDALRASDVVYFKRTFVNKSNETQKQSISFSAEKMNTIYVSVSEAYSSSKCEEQKSSFSEQFSTSVSEEFSTSISAWFMSVSAKFGMDVAKAFQKMSAQASSACSAEAKNRTESQTHVEVKKYSFSDEITIPANSLTTVTATSNPFRGEIPYTMTYELTPPANMGEKLKRGLEYYKFGDRLEKTDKGTVLVHFNGAMVVDSGYEIVVDVTAVPVQEENPGFLMNSKQSVFPSS